MYTYCRPTYFITARHPNYQGKIYQTASIWACVGQVGHREVCLWFASRPNVSAKFIKNRLKLRGKLPETNTACNWVEGSNWGADNKRENRYSQCIHSPLWPSITWLSCSECCGTRWLTRSTNTFAPLELTTRTTSFFREQSSISISSIGNISNRTPRHYGYHRILTIEVVECSRCWDGLLRHQKCFYIRATLAFIYPLSSLWNRRTFFSTCWPRLTLYPFGNQTSQ